MKEPVLLQGDCHNLRPFSHLLRHDQPLHSRIYLKRLLVRGFGVLYLLIHTLSKTNLSQEFALGNGLESLQSNMRRLQYIDGGLVGCIATLSSPSYSSLPPQPSLQALLQAHPQVHGFLQRPKVHIGGDVDLAQLLGGRWKACLVTHSNMGTPGRLNLPQMMPWKVRFLLQK